MKDQYDLFFNEPYKIKKKIRLIELFGGIGAQAKSLENLGVDFEHYRLCEFDKYAVASYNAVHHTDFVTSDITKIHAEDLGIVDTDKYDYILCYSFPCQDLSLAGKGAGLTKGSGTRSGLLWEVERLLKECDELPQILALENVCQVHSQKNANDFEDWCKFLNSLGYMNYWEDLNSKHYGIPQNRNRTIMISILGNYSYEFPKKQKLKLKLKDLLESEVDEKYYLSNKIIDCFMSNGTGKYPRKERFLQNINRPNQDIGNAVTTLAGSRATDNFVVENVTNKRLYETLKSNELKSNEIIDTYNKNIRNDGLSITITTRVCASNNTFVLVPEKTKKGYAEAYEGDGVYVNRPHQKRGVVQHDMIQTIKTSCDDLGVVVKDKYECIGTYDYAQGDVLRPNSNDRTHLGKDVSGSLLASGNQNGVMVKKQNNLRIRKLTPKECWRLMGFSDQDFDNASKVNSNAQLYKQAGNSIVVNVLMAVFKQLL